MIAYWLLAVTGLTNASGHAYLAWSGVISDFGLFGIIAVGIWHLVLFIRKHRCHVTACRRLGWHPVAGTPYFTCREHHPDNGITAADIRDAHRKATR